MVTFMDALLELVATGQIDIQEAHSHATDKTALLVALKGQGHDISAIDESKLMVQRFDPTPNGAHSGRHGAFASDHPNRPLALEKQ